VDGTIRITLGRSFPLEEASEAIGSSRGVTVRGSSYSFLPPDRAHGGGERDQVR
jgi:hypothetical protein